MKSRNSTLKRYIEGLWSESSSKLVNPQFFAKQNSFVPRIIFKVTTCVYGILSF